MAKVGRPKHKLTLFVGFMFWLFLISVFVMILCPAPLTFVVMGLFWLIGEVANAFR
jgi:hypothetical protein